jgi:N,N'-diacetyllegionaminate synthase
MEQALGSSEKAPTKAELANMEGMRRSIVAKRNIRSGQPVTEADLTCKRPATGLAPSEWDDVIGKIATRDIEAGSLLNRRDIHG